MLLLMLDDRRGLLCFELDGDGDIGRKGKFCFEFRMLRRILTIRSG